VSKLQTYLKTCF